MAKFVPDTKTRRWIIISPSRSFRPFEKKEKKKTPLVSKKGYNFKKDCPFCLGNEKMTPPEVFRWGKRHPTDPEWLARVVPNKYPITEVHEVIIHSPDHKKDLVDFSPKQAEILFKVFRARYRTLGKDGQVLIFNNKGRAAGPSLVHPHSQLVVVPRQIKLDVLPLEPVKNVVLESKALVCFCPEFSQWPYEVWLSKKECHRKGHKPGCEFGELSGEEIREVAGMVRQILGRLLKLFPDLPYNFYISPVGCWYLRIIPRLTIRAGFELGTGLHVNVVDPKEAAKNLRSKN